MKTECVFCHFDRYGKKRVLQDFYILILVRKHYACGKSSMKKMIKIAFVAAFAAIAGYGVYANQKSEVLSDLTLANVEALAGSGETTIECCLALWGTCKGDIKAPYVCASR